MNRLAFLILALSAILLMPPAALAAAQTFDAFAGDYTKHGHVTVSDGAGLSGSGRVRLYVHRTGNGRSARVILRGTLKIEGAVRPFSSVVVLGKDNSAIVSNLAPGVDDGHIAKKGSYSAGASRIHAQTSFVLNTTEGEAAFVIAVRAGGRRLIVTETLKATSLTSPITWRFTATSHR
jgi:hypothetical protein